MSSGSAAVAPLQADDVRLKSVVEKGVKFHIKAGNAKWTCTLLDRTTHERNKASFSRTNSSSSVSTTSSIPR